MIVAKDCSYCILKIENDRMSKASECLSLFDDFTTAERAQPCPTCTFYNVTCLGNNHPRKPTGINPFITIFISS